MKLFNKNNLIIACIIFLYIIFIEFPDIFIVGPIGIFGNSKTAINMINFIGKLVYMVPISIESLDEIFYSRILSCENPCAQLSRLYADIFGFVILAAVPLLSNKYINDKASEIIKISQIVKLNFYVSMYIALNVFIISIIPLISLFKLSIKFNGGSAFELFKYIIVWLIPSILVLVSLETFFVMITTEKFAQVLLYLLAIAPSLPASVQSYPFYKLVIRFNGKTESFYYEMSTKILINRLFVIGIITILILLTKASVILVSEKKTEYNKL